VAVAQQGQEELVAQVALELLEMQTLQHILVVAVEHH
jgi:hypothetical protein